MRFRGGGVGHTSTQATTDTFKNDLDIQDMESCRVRQLEERNVLAFVEDEVNRHEEDTDVDIEDSEAGEDREVGLQVEDELSESEMADYGYELEGDSDSSSEEEGEDEEENRDVEEEDYTTVDELGALGYAEY